MTQSWIIMAVVVSLLSILAIGPVSAQARAKGEQKATITNRKDGMDFIAGPEAFNDAHHAVLWTKQDFKGDLRHM
jgi:hypothetical protein